MFKIVRGSYMGFEGPMHRGTAPLRVEADDEPLHKLTGVTTATEGGNFDSLNGYDRAALSVGPIQLIPVAGLGALLRRILEQVPSEALAKLSAWESKYKADLLEAVSGPPYDKVAQKLYGCNGRMGSWNGAAWARAEELCIALATLLVHPLAQRIQLDYVASKILSWVMDDTREILFQDLHSEGWTGALQAAVVSFSANLPAVADKHFRAFVKEQGGYAPYKVNKAFVTGAIKAMTERPRISIYPGRRRAIIPAIERLYGVKFDPIVEAVPEWSVQRMQKALIKLGHDLGPAGADGKVGRLTKAAIVAFQRSKGLDPDGVFGPKTEAELAKVE